MNKTQRIITLISMTAVLIIALAGFALSFNAIYRLALDNGISPQLAWLMPIIVDLSIFAFSLQVLHAAISKQSTKTSWVLIAAFSLISIALNISHSNLTPIGIALAALAPIAIVTSFETLMRQIRTIVQGQINTLAIHWQKRAKTLQRLAREWKEQAKQLKTLVINLQKQIERLQAENTKLKTTERQLEELQQKYDHLKNIEPIPTSVGQYGRDILQVLEGTVTATFVAEKYGESVATVSRLTSKLNGGQPNG